VIRQLSVAALFAAAACATGPDISTQRDANIPIPTPTTWAWGKRDTISHYELDPSVAQNTILHSRIQQAIDKNLATKGWRKVDDPSQAQVVLTYHVGIKRTVELQGSSMSSGSGYGAYGGYGWGVYGAPTYTSTNIRPVEYKQGALLVLVRDRASNNVAWQGLYKKEVNDTDRSTPESIQHIVDALLSDLK
jgi:Domain of unknown function (DUF4136)